MTAVTGLIPFEAHITIDAVNEGEEQRFLSFCNEYALKPLLIELERGVHWQQAMISALYPVQSLAEVIDYIQPVIAALKAALFYPVRLKVEVPSQCLDQLVLDSLMTPTAYFEWHAKVLFNDIDALTTLCELHQAHLSRNALKGATTMRFVTLREYGGQRQFDGRVKQLKHALQQGGWQINKQQSEYCVYDSNVALDKGWLSNE